MIKNTCPVVGANNRRLRLSADLSASPVAHRKIRLGRISTSRMVGRLYCSILAALVTFTCWLPTARAERVYSTGTTTEASPIVLGGNAGNTIRGVSRAFLASSGQTGPDASIVLYDESAGALFTTVGPDTRIEHICFAGVDWPHLRDWYDQSPPTAEPAWSDVGLQVSYISGLATGRVVAENVCWQGFDVGVRLGLTANDPQCAENDFTSVWFLDCGTAVQSVNTQSMGNRFNTIRANACDKIFHFQGGGKFVCDGLFTATASTTILHIDPTGSPQTIGHNNASFEIRDLWLDAQAVNPMILQIEEEDYGSGRVELDGGHLSSSEAYTQPIFQLAGNISVTIRDYAYLRSDFIVFDNATHTTRLFIENCCIVGSAIDLFKLEECTGQIIVTIRDCYDATGQPIRGMNKRTLTGTQTP
jgi:hypothetical protein